MAKQKRKTSIRKHSTKVKKKVYNKKKTKKDEKSKVETLIEKNNELLERPYDKIMKEIKENNENVDHNVIISVKILEELMIDCYVMKLCSECDKLRW